MYNACMASTLQIRDVPEEVHTAVRARASAAGRSVSDYLRQLVTEAVSRPTMAEWIERAQTLARDAEDGPALDDIVAAVRSGRDR